MKVAIPKDVVELPNCVGHRAVLDTEVKCLNKAWMFRYESTHSETCSKIGSVRSKPSCVGHKGSIEMRYQANHGMDCSGLKVLIQTMIQYQGRKTEGMRGNTWLERSYKVSSDTMP